MPKPSTVPTLFDEAIQISVTKLKEWEYLNPGQIKNGTITWSSNGNQTGSISICVNTFTEQPFIDLDYKYREESRNYTIKLVSIPSNLGRGKIWYFLCPQTKKRCRKLYSIGGYFFHREAFSGCMYDSQIQSKKYRQWDKTLGEFFRAEQFYELLCTKHFKKTYAGKPTKKYSRLMEKIRQAESIPYSEIEHLMIFGI